MRSPACSRAKSAECRAGRSRPLRVLAGCAKRSEPPINNLFKLTLYTRLQGDVTLAHARSELFYEERPSWSPARARGLTRFQTQSLDRERPWEESVKAHAAGIPGPAQDLQWDLNRLRLFLDRWEQGRFVEFSRRERSAVHYHSRFGTEFSADVLLTCQGAPSLMRWRGKPLMKNVFDFAIYPVLIAELRPRTIFEIGSGSGVSAAWFADLLALSGADGRVHSVDIAEVQMQHPHVHFYKGDCSSPATLFPGDLLQTAPHPWLVVEDAHHNVPGVLDLLHPLSHPRRLSGRRGQRRQTRRNSRIRRCASRRLSRRYALHRQLRSKRNLRG